MSNWSAASCHQGIHATIALLGLLVILIVDVVHRSQSWVGLLVVFFLWIVTWLLLVQQKLFHREEAFRSAPAQELLRSVSQVYGVLNNNFPPLVDN